MDAPTRDRLAAALRQRYPWVAGTDLGPSAVEAGECDRCGAEARLVQTCGPGSAGYLGRNCVLAIGVDAWCVGHADEAEDLLRQLAALPPEADVATRLWWVATGEVIVDPELAERMIGRLPPIAGFAATHPGEGGT